MKSYTVAVVLVFLLGIISLPVRLAADQQATDQSFKKSGESMKEGMDHLGTAIKEETVDTGKAF